MTHRGFKKCTIFCVSHREGDVIVACIMPKFKDSSSCFKRHGISGPSSMHSPHNSSRRSRSPQNSGKDHVAIDQSMWNSDVLVSVSPDGRTLSMHNPRRSLGGRGREWASESHKLLEAMLELDDSKPFREPVDPLKYPVSHIFYGHPFPHDFQEYLLLFLSVAILWCHSTASWPVPNSSQLTSWGLCFIGWLCSRHAFDVWKL